MNVNLHTDSFWERWDYNSPDTTGIGGSETHQIEMAWRMAKRGHKVVSYGPIKQETKRDWKGSLWKDFRDTDFTRKGLWFVYRNPYTLDHFPEEHPGQEIWFIAQDMWYKHLDAERMKKVDILVCLCEDHKNYFIQRSPWVKDKVHISTNGIRVELIKEIEAEGLPERNPYRINYSSSPDRGLEWLLHIVKRAREYEPKIELHAYYGFSNMQKTFEKQKAPHLYETIKTRFDKWLNQPGVTFHDRVPQKELYRDWFKAGMWVACSNFKETSCITGLEAQAMGAVPIVNPLWGIAQNMNVGIAVYGDAEQLLPRAKFTATVVDVASNHELQQNIREINMPAIREKFDWERVVDQFEDWIRAKKLEPVIKVAS